MNIFRKLFLLSVLLVTFAFSGKVFAMTPTISLSIISNDSNNVQINVTGDANSGVVLSYYSTSASGPQMKSIGTTNSSGVFSGTIGLSDFNITQNSAVGVFVNGLGSSNISWPYASNSSATTNLTFNQSSAVLSVGQSSIITASNNGSNSLYLSSNSNPQIANISFSGNQITVTGLSVGQTTANVCVINSGASSNCASLYIVIQSASSQGLSFSQNNTSIISGQNVQINITGGNGFYQIQNNSNSSIMSTSLNGPVLTVYANGTSGSSTITVCSTDMSACGVVNASVGTYTTSGTGLSFTTNYPTIFTGNTSVINITGGYGTYYVSSNSNSTFAQTYISSNTITIYGNNPGTDSITVCAPSGECGVITATVVASSGGALTLSQNNISLISGQVLSTNVSGGTAPYSIIQSNDGIVQYSLSGSVITITGVKSGSSSATVCSSAGGCIVLNVTVTSNSSSVSGVQPVFSQNNVSINTNQTTAIYLSGNGGYYLSNNSNPNVLSATISGNSLILSAITVGSANISVCQTGGQCNTLYATVSNSITSTVNSVPITFDKTFIDVKVNGSSLVNISGGSGVGYYVSYNSNPDAVGVYVSSNSLNVTGKKSGTGTLSVCSSTNVCGSISVTVESQNQVVNITTNSKFIFTKPLKLGQSGNEVTELQKKLKEDGIYAGPITGYYGNLTLTAVKKYQKLHKLDQLGSVGPGTRAALNK